MHAPPSPELGEWCARHLGAAPRRTFVLPGNLSVVVGVELDDDRQVVIKARTPDDRLDGCLAVQRHLWQTGFPCPRPLAGPAPLGELSATAESYLAGGNLLAPGPASADRFAAALAALVRQAPEPSQVPPLHPPPPWVRYDHDAQGVWPRPASTDVDLNADPGPSWLSELARRTRARLACFAEPAVIGHVDFESQNLRWVGDRLHAVHDWDSSAQRPEAVVAGAAAAVFPATGPSAHMTGIADARRFLDAYARHRRQPWTPDEREAAWATGLWVCAYNAKIELVEGGGALAARLEVEADERLALAAV